MVLNFHDIFSMKNSFASFGRFCKVVAFYVLYTIAENFGTELFDPEVGLEELCTWTFVSEMFCWTPKRRYFVFSAQTLNLHNIPKPAKKTSTRGTRRTRRGLGSVCMVGDWRTDSPTVRWKPIRLRLLSQGNHVRS